MAALLQDIVSYLISKAVVTVDGVDIFRDFEPDTPDNIVVVSEYLGSPLPVGTTTVERGVQIVTRNKTYEGAQLKAQAVFNALVSENEDRRIDFTANRWAQIHIKGIPVKFKVDSLNRVYFVFNASVVTTRD